MDECKPLAMGQYGGSVRIVLELEGGDGDERVVGGWGSHSSTFQLNLSALYRIGGAPSGCVARVKGVVGVCRMCRVFSCVRHGSS